MENRAIELSAEMREDAEISLRPGPRASNRAKEIVATKMGRAARCHPAAASARLASAFNSTTAAQTA
jgi:acyl-CoA synthetase (NDP forming)